MNSVSGNDPNFNSPLAEFEHGIKHLGRGTSQLVTPTINKVGNATYTDVKNFLGDSWNGLQNITAPFTKTNKNQHSKMLGFLVLLLVILIIIYLVVKCYHKK